MIPDPTDKDILLVILLAPLQAQGSAEVTRVRLEELRSVSTVKSCIATGPF